MCTVAVQCTHVNRSRPVKSVTTGLMTSSRWCTPVHGTLKTCRPALVPARARAAPTRAHPVRRARSSPAPPCCGPPSSSCPGAASTASACGRSPGRPGSAPTAFYRHFDDMEELGLVLVEQSFGTLSDMLRVGPHRRRPVARRDRRLGRRRRPPRRRARAAHAVHRPGALRRRASHPTGHPPGAAALRRRAGPRPRRVPRGRRLAGRGPSHVRRAHRRDDGPHGRRAARGRSGRAGGPP